MFTASWRLLLLVLFTVSDVSSFRHLHLWGLFDVLSNVPVLRLSNAEDKFKRTLFAFSRAAPLWNGNTASNLENESYCLEPANAALIAEFLGNQLCDRQPCELVIVIMGCAISAKVIKLVWGEATSTGFNNAGGGETENRCPSASFVLNRDARMILNWWLKAN